LVSLTFHVSSHLWWVHAHYSPQLVELWMYVSSLLLSHTSHRSRTGNTWWGARRMLWCVRERSRPSSPSQLWVAGPLSPYNVIIYLFCIDIRSCAIIHRMCETWSQHTWWLCSRLGLGAPKPGCDRSGIRGMLTIGRNLDRTRQPLSTYLCYSDSF
jgi:hypothetical protein